MRRLGIFLIFVVGVLMLSSCGTSICLNRMQPSVVNLPRGLGMFVLAEARGPLRYELVRAFHQQMAADGFYSISPVPANTVLRLHRVELERDTSDHAGNKKHKDSDVRRIGITADVMYQFQRIHRRECSVYVYQQSDGHPDWERACEELAREVMQELTPHMGTYCLSVDEVDENPAVEHAAQACAAGQWESGREYVRQALARNPDEAEAYFVLGIIELHHRRYAESSDAFRKAYALKPESKYLKAMQGNTAMQQDEQRASEQWGE